MNIDEETPMFPDYETLFGRFAFMAKNIEKEINVRHFHPKKASDEDLKEIKEKTRKASKHPNYEEETSFLNKILKLVDSKITDNKQVYIENMSEVIKRGNRLPGLDTFSDDPVMKAKMMARWAVTNVNQYTRSQKSPYFGKVIFQNTNSDTPMELYFGKAAVDLEGRSERVIDWRAPISDLYYKYTGIVKNAFFKVDDNEIHGELKLKRQITVEEGTITMLSDGGLKEVIREIEDAVIQEDSSDEILVANLDKSAHKRLGEIVATIQKEQNEIIRAPIDRITLVQGVAGGGKTTIALHRLAYLMYNDSDLIRPENVMVIAPNNVFLDYISGILPDLGVEYINQTTIEDFLLERLNLPTNLKFMNKMEISAKSYEDSNFDKEIEKIRRLKGDLKILEFVNELKKSLEKKIIQAFENYPYYPIHSKKVNHDYIRSLFFEFRNLPWNRREKYISDRLETIVRSEILENSMNPSSANNRIKSEVKNIKSYLENITYPPLLEAYRMLFQINEVKLFLSDKLGDEFERTLNSILKSLDDGILCSDDLPILFKITELYEEKKSRDLDYVVVDEAQDLTSVEMQILKENTKPNALCIVGDINQTIHSDGHFDTLADQVKAVFGDNSYTFHKLLKSYRSTIEITSYANKVLEQLNSPHIATPVIRHGNRPTIQQVEKQDVSSRIKLLVSNSQKAGRKSIVVTTRTEKYAKDLFQDLRTKIQDLSYVSEEETNYDIGVHVMPSYLTKGLEFDTVIVVNEEELDENASNRELRLQYVMYTRALHELNVLNLVYGS